MYRLGLAVLVFITGVASGVAAPPDPSVLTIPDAEVSKARTLVQRLGSNVFREREEAQSELLKMGRTAYSALLDGLTHANPEIRFRCKSLLPQAEAADLKARLDVFLADTEGQYDHDLPAWNEFREAIGVEWRMLGYTMWADRDRDRSARALFVELLAEGENRNLLLGVGGPAGALRDLIATQKQELYNRRFPRTGNGSMEASPRPMSPPCCSSRLTSDPCPRG